MSREDCLFALWLLAVLPAPSAAQQVCTSTEFATICVNRPKVSGGPPGGGAGGEVEIYEGPAGPSGPRLPPIYPMQFWSDAEIDQLRQQIVRLRERQKLYRQKAHWLESQILMQQGYLREMRQVRHRIVLDAASDVFVLLPFSRKWAKEGLVTEAEAADLQAMFDLLVAKVHAYGSATSGDDRSRELDHFAGTLGSLSSAFMTIARKNLPQVSTDELEFLRRTVDLFYQCAATLKKEKEGLLEDPNDWKKLRNYADELFQWVAAVSLRFAVASAGVDVAGNTLAYFQVAKAARTIEQASISLYAAKLLLLRKAAELEPQIAHFRMAVRAWDKRHR